MRLGRRGAPVTDAPSPPSDDADGVGWLFEAAMTDLGFRAAESAAVREFVEAGAYGVALDTLRRVCEGRCGDPIGWLLRLRKAVEAEKNPSP
jgi:hypothetical protein